VASLYLPETLVKIDKPGLGNLDEFRFVDTLVRDVDPGRTNKVPKGSSLFIRGWALLPAPPRPAAGVFASVGRGLWFETVYGKSRPDIATVHGGENTGSCGYSAVHKLAGVDTGTHELLIGALDGDGGYYEIARRTFEILPSRELLAGKIRAAAGQIHVSIDGVATLRDPAAFDGKTLRARIGDVVYVRGWAVDMEARAGLAGVLGVFDEDEFVLGVHGLPRDDAAGAVSMPRARRCGFTLRMPTQNMRAGRHTLDVAIVTADGTSYLTHRVAAVELSG
jgi:hypothetical protein